MGDCMPAGTGIVLSLSLQCNRQYRGAVLAANAMLDRVLFDAPPCTLQSRRMLELNPLYTRIKDLDGRLGALRGYL